jgi:hypothetical protein
LERISTLYELARHSKSFVTLDGERGLLGRLDLVTGLLHVAENVGGVRRRPHGGYHLRRRETGGSVKDRGPAQGVTYQDLGRLELIAHVRRHALQICHVRRRVGVGEVAFPLAQPGEVEPGPPQSPRRRGTG